MTTYFTHNRNANHYRLVLECETRHNDSRSDMLTKMNNDTPPAQAPPTVHVWRGTEQTTLGRTWTMTR